MNYSEIISQLSSKGQVTVPAPYRKSLGVTPGSTIIFRRNQLGEIVIVAPKYPTVSSLTGAAGSLAKPLPFKEMKRIALEERFEKRSQGGK